jgi:hypothetical protein
LNEASDAGQEVVRVRAGGHNDASLEIVVRRVASRLSIGIALKGALPIEGTVNILELGTLRRELLAHAHDGATFATRLHVDADEDTDENAFIDIGASGNELWFWPRRVGDRAARPTFDRAEVSRALEVVWRHYLEALPSPARIFQEALDDAHNGRLTVEEPEDVRLLELIEQVLAQWRSA